MVYRSSFKKFDGIQTACDCPLLPLRATLNGQSPTVIDATDSENISVKIDIVDEAITYFRANVLFRKFEVKNPGDKLLIYLTYYINLALKKCDAVGNRSEGIKVLNSLAVEGFALPGQPDFPLGGLLSPPKSKDEAETFRSYIKQLREEVNNRLMERIYLKDGSSNKWWLAFGKRRFLNIVLP